jgi:hypothetical protein
MTDPATGGFRLWYMSRAERSTETGRTPTLRTNGYDLTLYATSPDGLAWTKPALGIHPFEGSAANNIVFDLHSPSVLLDSRDPDPSRRYKMLGYFHGAYHSATSPDGLHWTRDPREKGIIAAADTITLAQDPRTGHYLAYHKRPDPKGRTVWLSESADFVSWSKAERVFASDAFDAEWTTKPTQRVDVYNMAVMPHAGGFLGFPAMFRIMRMRAKSEVTAEQSNHDGPIDIQLATSVDGRIWRRTTPRVPIIPRGAPGTFDGGAMLGVTNTAVHTATETWIYYTAINTGHGAPMPPKRLTIGRAEWRRHGFVSLDAGPDGGRIETVPLQLGHPSLIVNADAHRGQLSVALLEADGSPIAGFSQADCEPLKADATQWSAVWRNRPVIPTDRPVRVVLEFTNTALYSLGTTLTPEHR